MIEAIPVKFDDTWKVPNDEDIKFTSPKILEWRVGDRAPTNEKFDGATLMEIINRAQHKSPCGTIPDLIEVTKCEFGYTASVCSPDGRILSRAIADHPSWSLRALLRSVE